MKHVDTLIVGGGQAGLALSRCLTDRSVTHVVLERGQIGERWRSERWDSLRLLTPRWQSRLPGHAYRGPDPDGYMSRQEVIEYLEGYAAAFPAPVETGVTVESAQRIGQEYIGRLEEPFEISPCFDPTPKDLDLLPQTTHGQIGTQVCQRRSIALDRDTRETPTRKRQGQKPDSRVEFDEMLGCLFAKQRAAL